MDTVLVAAASGWRAPPAAVGPLAARAEEVLDVVVIMVMWVTVVVVRTACAGEVASAPAVAADAAARESRHPLQKTCKPHPAKWGSVKTS